MDELSFAPWVLSSGSLVLGSWSPQTGLTARLCETTMIDNEKANSTRVAADNLSRREIGIMSTVSSEQEKSISSLAPPCLVPCHAPQARISRFSSTCQSLFDRSFASPSCHSLAQRDGGRRTVAVVQARHPWRCTYRPCQSLSIQSDAVCGCATGR